MAKPIQRQSSKALLRLARRMMESKAWQDGAVVGGHCGEISRPSRCERFNALLQGGSWSHINRASGFNQQGAVRTWIGRECGKRAVQWNSRLLSSAATP